MSYRRSNDSTARKPVRIRECTECPDNFMTIEGNGAILLSQHRPATLDMYGHPLQGTCPRHKKPRKEPENENGDKVQDNSGGDVAILDGPRMWSYSDW